MIPRTLHTILGEISHIKAPEGWVARTRHMLFPEEEHIRRMRQRLDDSLRVFQVGALVELLAQDPNLTTRAAVADPPEPNHPQALGPLNAPTEERLCTHRRQARQAVEQVQDSILPPSLPGTRPHTREARSPRRYAAVVKCSSSSPEDGKIPAAFMKVERCRRSVQHRCSPTQKKELAAALGRLATLLDKSGRTDEALAASQESAELFKSQALTERVH
ncbi:hypothetical protein FRC11_002199 [Ceratobasidium sp. 423]|nr:hypothetical protein FRC11_002199 [Ceratobasidium sp. 423]